MLNLPRMLNRAAKVQAKTIVSCKNYNTSAVFSKPASRLSFQNLIFSNQSVEKVGKFKFLNESRLRWSVNAILVYVSEQTKLMRLPGISTIAVVLVSYLAMNSAQSTTKNSISSHVLDISRGVPAEGVRIQAYYQTAEDKWEKVGSTVTNANGRVDWISPGQENRVGVYKLKFKTGDYYKALNTETFYPWASIVFQVKDATQHYHVPLTLSPFGYSTYRGS